MCPQTQDEAKQEVQKSEWKMTLPMSSPIELLMDATLEVIPKPSDYAEWDYLFRDVEFSRCLPLVERHALELFRSLCEGVSMLQSVRAEPAFYGMDDYCGLFTIELRGSREMLEAIREQVVSADEALVVLHEDQLVPGKAPELVWDEYKQPWPSWLSSGHSRPFWPPVIEAA